MTGKKRERGVVYRPGDVVRFCEGRARLVERVGYPLSLQTLFEQRALEIRAAAESAVRGLLGVSAVATSGSIRLGSSMGECPTWKDATPLERELTYMLLRSLHFGGPERRVYISPEPLPFLADTELRVLGKVTRNTGDYYPGAYFHDPDGGRDYEPGGLSNRAMQVILAVRERHPSVDLGKREAWAVLAQDVTYVPGDRDPMAHCVYGFDSKAFAAQLR